ncbi:hypothetical protein A4D02_17260 [Niastella koreensis]|uniref:Two component transcriptional regulator, LuxR family n=2 Tax=Niastella koreensis TaxID=354356 RepID=G8TE48_NIAKG|nr:response regulator transcription factor [Niastella koreensis]AEV97239.1 two component transcriptional regulator, LuxR family [Niastella koreensis GR20-10]OQP39084.1 hypothetical protein A4D02_17260 [Niastella koreensis]
MNDLNISLAIADDHRAVRQAFRNAFSRFGFLSVAFEAENGKDLIAELSRQQPDVVLLDIKMPEVNGIEALKIIHEKFPTVKILILTAYFDEVYVAECLQYGINGYLTKNMDILDIVNAIKMAFNNEVYLTNLLMDSHLKSYIVKHKKNMNTVLPEFTCEELKILELMKLEKTTDEISHIMHLSKRSIELKRDKMKEKANVKTIGGLLLYCLKRGFIE